LSYHALDQLGLTQQVGPAELSDARRVGATDFRPQFLREKFFSDSPQSLFVPVDLSRCRVGYGG